MRIQLALLALLSASGALQAAGTERPDLVRHNIDAWEQDIGYSGVVQDGDLLYLSGVACEGADMEAAVADCYRRLTAILQRFGADSSQVVRETIYTTDLDALIRAIPGRKRFFPDARYPAATWVEVRRLYQPGHLLEVEWTVRLRQPR
ncbi:MAG: RidA family protein [Pseudoxanthomonas sp.]|nr:RidA family protein [Pseudoxanthomonas sp.]